MCATQSDRGRVLGKWFMTGEKFLKNVNTDVCVVAYLGWFMNLWMLTIHGKNDSQTCVRVWLQIFVYGFIASLIVCVCVCIPEKCLSAFCMFRHTCWQSKKAFSKEDANPLCWSMLQIEATLGVLIKTALLQLGAKWNWWTRAEGGDEGGWEGGAGGGGGGETDEGPGEENEHHCLPSSLLCWSLSSFLMALDSLTIKRGMEKERGRKEKKAWRGS